MNVSLSMNTWKRQNGNKCLVKLTFLFLLSYPLAGLLKRLPDNQPALKNLFIIVQVFTVPKKQHLKLIEIAHLHSTSSDSSIYGLALGHWRSAPSEPTALHLT